MSMNPVGKSNVRSRGYSSVLWPFHLMSHHLNLTRCTIDSDCVFLDSTFCSSDLRALSRWFRLPCCNSGGDKQDEIPGTPPTLQTKCDRHARSVEAVNEASVGRVWPDIRSNAASSMHVFFVFDDVVVPMPPRQWHPWFCGGLLSLHGEYRAWYWMEIHSRCHTIWTDSTVLTTAIQSYLLLQLDVQSWPVPLRWSVWTGSL